MNIDSEIDRVINDYAKMIYKIALSYLSSKDDAEDISQEVMIKYISFIKTNKFNNVNHEKNWLIRVTLNLCYNELKSAKRKNNISYEDGVINSYSKKEDYTQEEIFDLIRKLKDKYRTVFELFYIQDLKMADISRILNISESNVKIRLMRAKKELQKYLKARDSNNYIFKKIINYLQIYR